jgi:GTP-binding protein
MVAVLSRPAFRCTPLVKISSARFVKSAKQPADFPRDQRPEIAFCGRSNIGKSSLLNVLTNSRGLARTSSTPGRTQTINFFLINDRLYFADLPGYGFARVAKEVRSSWGPMIEGYLRNRPQLKLTLMLVDSRMPPTESDVLMKNWLDHYRIPNAVVLTKIDKISRNQLQQALRTSVETLNTKEIIPFSAVTSLGKDLILSKVAAVTK